MNRLSIILISGCFLISCGDHRDTQPVTGRKDSPRNSVLPSAKDYNVNPYVIVDVSPMDMSYFPTDYPKLKMTDTSLAPPLARLIYSRPHLQGRHLFHEVQKFGQPWRLGANESTELELYQPATIQDKKIQAGRYILYCIPEEKEWTIVLNGFTDSWGLKQEPARDIARFVCPVSNTSYSVEYFTMLFQGKDKNASLIMAWDNYETRLPIRFQ